MTSSSVAEIGALGAGPSSSVPEALPAAKPECVRERGDAASAVAEAEAIRALYRRLARSQLVSLLLGAAMLVCLAQSLLSATSPEMPAIGYIDSHSRGYRVYPIRGPLRPGPWIRSWAENTILAAYSVDYLNYRAEFTRIRRRFTASGWASFAAAFKGSGDFQRLLTGRLVSNAQAQGPPVLRTENRDRYVIQFPMVVTFANDNEAVRRRLMLTVFVRAVSIARHPEGFAVSRVTAKGRIR